MALWHKKIWTGISSVIENPHLLSWLHRWNQLPEQADKSRAAELFVVDRNSPDAANLMVLQAVDDDFCYRHYVSDIGNHASSDMTGRLVSEFGGELGEFFSNCYREVLRKKQPVYTVHYADRVRNVSTWERLILPLRDSLGNDWLVVYNAPMESNSQMLEAVMNSTSDGILVLRPVRNKQEKIANWLVLMANPQVCSMLGIKDSDPIGHTFKEVFPQWKKLGLNAQLNAVMEKTSLRHFELNNTIESKMHHFAAQARPLNDGCVLRLTDITDFKRAKQDLKIRKQMEGALRKSNDVLQAVLQNIPSGLSVFDDQLKLVSYNKRFHELLDLPSELFSTPTTRFEDIIRHNAKRGEYGNGNVEEIIKKIIEKASKPTPHRFERISKGGITLDIQGEPMPKGGFVTTYTDISNYKRAELAVRESEERLQRALAASQLCLWDYDLVNGSLYLSESWSVLLGGPSVPTKTTLEALGDMIPAQDQSLLLTAMSGALTGLTPGYYLEHRVNRPDGSQIWIASEGKVVAYGADGEPVRAVGTNRDITERKLKDQALQNALIAQETYAANLNATLDNMAQGIASFDKDYKLTFLNSQAEKFLSLPPELLAVGTNFHDMVSFQMLRGDFGEKMELADAKAKQFLQRNDFGFSTEKTNYLRTSSEGVSLRVETSPLAQGGWVRTFTDVTRYIESEQAVQKTSSLLSGVLDAASEISIMATDKDRIFTVFNKGAERLLGYEASEVVGILTPSIFHDSVEIQTRNAEFVAEQKNATESVTTSYDETTVLGQERVWTYKRKDGSRFTIALTVNAIHAADATFLGYMHVGRDVTAQREYERTLKETTQAAVQLAQAKASFLATMSHEIRTPMNGVIGMTSLLLETPLSAEQREFTEVIRTSGESLMVVINDILDYSKIESGNMELEQHTFDLQEGVESSIDLLALKAQEKRLDLLYLIDTDVPRWIFGDLPRLRQVLVNLISNALKFTEFGEVLVTVKRKRLQPDGPNGEPENPMTLEFSVQDTGIGIAPTAMSRLFKAFSQVDSSTSRKYGGTGLGLAISKRLVEAMGGDLQVESVWGKGTRFFFTMLTQAAPALLSTPSVSPHELEGKRVMMVDDNATNLRILGLQAQRWGMQPFPFLTPREALEHIRGSEHFDLLITDFHMPEMDGLAFATEVQRLRPKLPKVLLSSSGMRQTEEIQLFDVVMTKPMRQSSLLDAFMRALPPLAHASPAANSPQVAKSTQFDPDLGKRLPMRILLAEDNEVNQKLALRVLQGFGYLADVAANGLEVLEALERQHYDLVLMDIQMPEMDGLQATRAIVQKWSAGDRPRIVAVSANAMREDMEAATHAGMDGYITKPITLTALRSALTKWGAYVADHNRSEIVADVPAKQLQTQPSDVLNLDQLAGVTEIDPSGEFLGELLASFISNMAGMIAKLKQALAKADMVESARLSHQMKGLAANLGASRLTSSCTTLETQIKKGHAVGLVNLAHTIELDFKDSLQAFAELQASYKPH